MGRARSIRARLEELFIPEPNTGCWLWLGSLNIKGYGLFAFNAARGSMAHRATYEEYVGPIPKGLELDHKCRVRCCVNPDHLEPVTHKENLHRSPAFGEKKKECPRGHVYSAENTKRNRRGYRYCWACAQANNAVTTERRRMGRIEYAAT